MNKLRLTEIFFSLQGEANTVGIPTVFVRLTGCPLRCQYCDTAYAFQGGSWHAFEAILQQIRQYKTNYVTVTGGEPLAQKDCIPFLKLLCDSDYQVSLETSGALDISAVDQRVSRVMDIKTPGSGEVSKNLWSNVTVLSPHDQVKFVICNEQDYDWAKAIIQQYALNKRCLVLFSPSYQQISPQWLADKIIVDQLPVRFQIQLHKILWGDVSGR